MGIRIVNINTFLTLSISAPNTSTVCIQKGGRSNMSMCSIRIEIDGVGCVPACQYPVMHSRLLSHAFIHTFILLPNILLIHSRAYQPVNIQSCVPGFSVMHSSTHSFFYPLFYSFIRVRAYQPANIQSGIPGFSVMHSSPH
jgi:hypothetical protein